MKKIDEIIQGLRRSLDKIAAQTLPGPEQEERYQCPVCKDRGLVLVGNRARVCSCVKQNRLLRSYRYANITPEIEGCTFEDFRLDYYRGNDRKGAQLAWEAARQFTEDYLKNRHTPGILLTGSVGAGKTYLAAAITNRLIQHKVGVLFLVVPDFLDELRSTYHRNGNGESAETDDVTMLNNVRQVDVLVLDDLGVHNYTPWTCNKLYSLLNYRLNYRLPVIITTNLSLGKLEGFLGERTTSRIVQMCRIYELNVDKDIRHQKNLSSYHR